MKHFLMLFSMILHSIETIQCLKAVKKKYNFMEIKKLTLPFVFGESWT